MRSTKVRSMVLSAMFTALMAAAAYIKIPVSIIPITVQTAVVMLSGSLLGRKNGAFSMIIYIVLGLMGAPVFSGGGGISYVLSPTFGYIIGFAAGAYVVGRITENAEKNTYRNILTACFAGLAVIYAFGTLYCVFISRYYLGKNIGLGSIFVNCIFLTLPFDIVLAFFSAFLTRRLSRAVGMTMN